MELLFIIPILILVLIPFIKGVNWQAFNNSGSKSKGKQSKMTLFYRYGHESVRDWIEWMKSKDEITKNVAFNQLADYMREPQPDNDLLTQEAINALAELGRPELADILVEVVSVVRKNWPLYKDSYGFYEKAAKLLMSICPPKAKELFINEIKTIKNRPGMEKIQLNLLEALLMLPPSDRDVTEILVEIISGSIYKLELRRQAINLLTDRELDEKRTIFNKVLSELIASSARYVDNDDIKVMELLLPQALECVSDENDRELWNLLIEGTKKGSFSDLIATILSKFMADKQNVMSKEQIMEIYRIKGPYAEDFRKSLSERFKLSEEEKSIIEEPNLLERIPRPKDIISIDTSERELAIPQALFQLSNDLRNLIYETEKKCIHIIPGVGEFEKYFLTRAIAKRDKKNFIYVKMKSIFSLDDQSNKSASAAVRTFNRTIRENKPCIVFFEDIATLLTGTRQPSSKNFTQIQMFLEIIGELIQLPTVFFVSTVPFPMAELFEQGLNLKEVLEEIPQKGLFLSAPIEIGMCTDKEKEDIFNHYDLKIRPDRPRQITFANIAAATNGFSMIEYLSYLNKYFKTSLLIFGELISLIEFENAAREEDINKIKSGILS